jgi:putative transcriptional regulator
LRSWPTIIDEESEDMANAANRILRSVERARAYARGEATEGFVAHIPAEVDVTSHSHETGTEPG